MFFYLIAFAAGLALATQAAINSQLSKAVGEQPVVAALISFFTGTLLLLFITLSKANLSEIWFNLPHQPWWKWIGGPLGAMVVFTTVLLAPKVGVSNMLFFIIVGQLIMAMLIDHYGLISMPVRSATLWKFIGLTVVFIGMTLFFYGDKWFKS
ncbi:DMT family transporter [Testudinibacter sp. TR-2022]|nr:DMT family transporter [Pasteurellaceae bacterium Phil31]TNH09961.1 DMT family transporter [Testudinibacter sp. TR-2022]TNH12419.1 DMT family transporter [Testudinibacter sp. TR-2022]TNH16234.1 DMT family transporter [Testudinibacter sp. TR-2022]TNH19250.1 DMT family transporter [Testudinibacter sp. TR-2022]